MLAKCHVGELTCDHPIQKYLLTCNTWGMILGGPGSPLVRTSGFSRTARVRKPLNDCGHLSELPVLSGDFCTGV
jgi:hypothetical protein